MSMELVPAPSPEPSLGTEGILGRSQFCSDDTPESYSNLLTLAGIGALLALLACSLMFLGVFGAFRRCCINRKLSLFGFVAYTILLAALAYTLGLIQNAKFCHRLLPLGAFFLMVALGTADSYTVHSLEEVERWRSFKIEWLSNCYMVVWVILTYTSMVTIVLLVLALGKVDGRIRALISTSGDIMQKNCIFLADYMKTTRVCSDPPSLQSCTYYVSEAKETKAHLWFLPAFWRKRQRCSEGTAPDYRVSLCMTEDVITIEKVWRCTGRLLSKTQRDPDDQLKDLCLSFSLFNLIRLRFAGYSLPQEAHQKLRSLLQCCLLSEKDGCERIFRVIEVELAFLFDLFYTNFSVAPSPYYMALEILQLVVFLAFSLAIISAYGEPRDKSTWFGPDGLVTLLMMISVVVVGIVQFGIRIFSEWAKVVYICMYVRNAWCQKNRIVEKLIEIMCRVKLRKPWARQLRQYSLLEKCSYSPPKLIYNRFTAAYFDQKRDGQQEIAPTRLSKEVMEAIVRSLMENGPSDLKNGRASLRRNKMENQLSWACDHESTTCVIMVWHIATSICEHEQRRKGPIHLAPQSFNVAIMLSNYLAYLVAQAPRLLPDHPCRTEFMFNCVVREARKLFGRSYRIELIFGHVVRKARELFGGRRIWMDERIRKLEDLGKKTSDETIMGQGARLGKPLIEAMNEHEAAMNGEHIWTVLAEFWAEMMLYVAPSNDMRAHAKYLATGGEFVTHLWVFLSHAGIVRSSHGGERHDDSERC